MKLTFRPEKVNSAPKKIKIVQKMKKIKNQEIHNRLSWIFNMLVCF